MENTNGFNTSHKHKRITLGFILLCVGGLLLLKQLAFFTMPFWLFSWPTALIVIGLAHGIRHNFRRPASFIMIALGALFLTNLITGFSFIPFWPVILILLGLRFILFGESEWHRQRRAMRQQWCRQMYNQPNSL